MVARNHPPGDGPITRIPPELEAVIGVYSAPARFTIEAGMVAAFRAALGELDPVRAGWVPLVFLANAPFRTGLRPAEPGTEGRRRLAAATRYELARPLQLGEMIGVSAAIAAARVKPGRSGELLFVDTEYRYPGLGRCVQTMVHVERSEAGAPGRQSHASVEARGRSHSVTARQLAMWAGASGDFNELHYDDRAARAAGHPAVLVAGSLKLALLEALLTAQLATDEYISVLESSHRKTDYVDEPLGLVVERSGDRAALRIEAADGPSLHGSALIGRTDRVG